MVGYARIFHMPYPYNKSNIKKLNIKIKKFRQEQHRKCEVYRKQQVFDRAAAQVQLQLLETNLADRIERASARYNDIVGLDISMDNLHSLIDQNETTDIGQSVSNRTQKNISDFKHRLSGT